ncbi:MAG TPA: hypothetical protein PKI90_05385 [bacterium]|nr:hypothetical protein [bacterium]
MNRRQAPPYHTLFTGRYTPSEVSVLWEESLMPLSGELQAAIDEAWERLDPNPHFNGRIARLEEWEIEADALRLRLRPTEYKHLLYSNGHTGEIIRRWGERYLSRALGISAVVVSSEGQIMLMQRSDRVGEYPGCYDLFGGHIDLPAPGESTDPFVSMAKELEEEIALSPGAAELTLFGLLLTREARKPELLFDARCSLESRLIMQAALSARDRYEYTRLMTISADSASISSFLARNRGMISPSAFGALELFAANR